MALSLSSPDFTAGGEIPELFTCQGREFKPLRDSNARSKQAA